MPKISWCQQEQNDHCGRVWGMVRRGGRRKARNRCIRELRKWLTMGRLGRVGEGVGFPDERLIAGESAWENDIRLRRTISTPGAWTISEPQAQTISASRTGREVMSLQVKRAISCERDA